MKIIKRIQILIVVSALLAGAAFFFSITYAAQISAILFAAISVIGTMIMLRTLKAAMIKQRESNELNKILINSAPIIINLWDASPKLISTSNQAKELFGLSTNDEYIEKFYTLSPEYQPCGKRSAELIPANIEAAMRDGFSRFEWLHCDLKGNLIPVEITLVRFERHGEQMLVAYTTDLSLAKAAQEKEREAHEATQTLLDASPVFVEIWDEDRQLIDCNTRAMELFNAPDKETYIKNFPHTVPELQPCGTPSMVFLDDVLQRAFRDGFARSEWLSVLPDAGMLPLDCTYVRMKRDGKNVVVSYSHDLRRIRAAESKEREAAEESLAKTRFLARMSHEIRTPMNAVLGIAENQLHNKAHPHETEEAFLRIFNSSRLLLTIINDILDLSKVEAGKMEIVPAKYEFASMVIDTVQLNLMYLGSRDIEFSLEIDEGIPACLTGDESRVKQILNNLLSNAFKYTQSGEIALTFGLEDATEPDEIILTINVRDTGQGMDEEHLKNLFKIEYTRFNIQNNRAIEGSGLGMMIAHHLINLMRGEISVESEPGKGSTFNVRIPQKPCGGAKLGKETVEHLQNLEVTQKSMRKVAKFSRNPMPYGKVLIVDDVETNLYVVKGILMPYKITTEAVTSGLAAIEKIKAGEVYDIIFMDHMMPGMDGIEATKIIRSMGYTAPIVALTANVLKGVEETFTSCGFDDFIPKPINFNRFDKCLTKYIKNKHSPEAAETAKRAHMEPDVPAGIIEPFLKDARNAMSVLEKYKSGEKPQKSFIIQAHSMKSALINIGRVALSETAYTLEKAGRDEDTQKIDEVFPQFMEDLRAVIDELSAKSGSEKSEDVDDDRDFVRAQFAKITLACETYDIAAARSALALLDAAQCSGKTKELVRSVYDCLLLSDYDEAAILAEKGVSL